jgi:dnd system-associated protein 4
MATRDRIYVSKSAEVQKIYDALKTDDKPKSEFGDMPTKPFRFDRDIFLAAAALGFRSNKFLELPATDRKEKFNWSTLLNDEHAITALQIMAFQKTSDPEVLLDDDKVASIAEGYANAGIHLLAKRIQSSGVDELEEAAHLMAEIFAESNDT